MPEKLLKIVLRRFIDATQNHINSVKNDYSGYYWELMHEAYRDALIEAGIELKINYIGFGTGANYRSLVKDVRILSKTDEYRHILTELGFASDINDGIPTYSFKI